MTARAETNNTVGLLREEEIRYLRSQFEETVKQLGVPFKYRYPLGNDVDDFSQPAPDGYSCEYDVYGIFDGDPKVKTYRNLGWVVEKGDNLPFLIHIPFSTTHIQKGCLFQTAGQITDISERIFQVTELSSSLVCPDHIVCQIVPLVGNTPPKTAETRRDIALKNAEPRRFLKKE